MSSTLRDGVRPAERLLVTGGAGFIGSAIVRQAIAAGLHVLNLDKLTYASSLESLRSVEDSPNYRFLRADICDADAVRHALEQFQPDIVLHLAAESHVDRSIDAPGDFIETNVVGTFTLLNEARRYWSALPPDAAQKFCFVQVSTDEVFGSLGPNGLFDDASPYAPNSPYSASKASGDHLARAWHTTYGLPVIVTNCSNNYGPYQFPEKLIPLAIGRAASNRPVPVYGNGSNIRDWLHVDDHAVGLLLAATRGRVGATYLFGGRSERTNLEVVRAIFESLDRIDSAGAPHERIEFVPDRPGHDHRYAIDSSTVERELSWTPRHTFESGIHSTVEWYLGNAAWVESVQRGRYAGERLGTVGISS